MRGRLETAWLYTRGPQSVRLAREEIPNGCRLLVYGPEADVVAYDFPDVMECIKRQAEIEFGLVAAGYQLAQQSSERRGQDGVRQGPAHRRAS
jgi:hypothetical protein